GEEHGCGDGQIVVAAVWTEGSPIVDQPFLVQDVPGPPPGELESEDHPLRLCELVLNAEQDLVGLRRPQARIDELRRVSGRDRAELVGAPGVSAAQQRPARASQGPGQSETRSERGPDGRGSAEAAGLPVPAQAQAGGEVSEQQQILRVETGGSGLAAVAAVDTVHAIVAPEDGTAGAAIADVVHGAPEREGARAVEAGLLLREVAGDPGVETGEGRALQESLGVFDLPDRRPAAEAGAAVAERLRRVPVPDPRRQRVGVAGVAVEGQRTGPQRTVAALQPRRRGPDPGLALAQRPASLHA